MSILGKFYPQSIDKSELDQLFGHQAAKDQSRMDQLAQMISSGIISPADLSRILSGLEGLTPEESQELSRLKEEHVVKVKIAKLNVFKKLAPEMRQFVLNAFGWRRHLDVIQQTTADKDQRLVDLETKSNHGRLFTQDSTSFQRWPAGIDPRMFDDINRMITLPDGITEQDLEQAHLEATLEEEMLNGQKD